MSRGHDREREVKRLLEIGAGPRSHAGAKWLVVRAAGSLGTVDLVAMRYGWIDADTQGRILMLIEVKSTLTPYAHFLPAERAALSEAAAFCGAEAWLAYWPKRGKLQWIPESAWPQQAVAA